MRNRLFALAACSALTLAACSRDPVSVDEYGFVESEVLNLVPDYAVTSAAVIDGAGIGASRLPEALQLTAEQKAAIAALHEAFQTAHADEFQTLKDLESQIRELRRSGGDRQAAGALFAQAKAILDGLADDFAKLQEDIWAVYTAEQRAWTEEHRPRMCDRRGPPQLTEDQVARIRALKAAFQAAIADDLALVKQIHESARTAKQNGASAEEVRAILATAQAILDRIKAAERQLMADIDALLTPEQRERWCVVRRHTAPGRP